MIFEAAEQLRSAVRALVYGTAAATLRDARTARPRLRLLGGVRQRFVLVDDDPIVRRLLRTTLPSESFDCSRHPTATLR